MLVPGLFVFLYLPVDFIVDTRRLHHLLSVGVLLVTAIDPELASAVVPEHGVLAVKLPVPKHVETVQVGVVVKKGVAVYTPDRVFGLTGRIGDIVAPSLRPTAVGALVEFHICSTLVEGRKRGGIVSELQSCCRDAAPSHQLGECDENCEVPHVVIMLRDVGRLQRCQLARTSTNLLGLEGEYHGSWFSEWAKSPRR